MAVPSLQGNYFVQRLKHVGDHIRVCVFVDRDSRSRVGNEQHPAAVFNAGLADCFLYLGCDVDQFNLTFALDVDPDHFRLLPEAV